MTDIVATEIKKDAGWLTFGGVLTVIVGVLALSSPFYAGVAVSMFAGAALLVGGVIRAIAGFKAQSWGGTILALLVGLATTVCGLIVLARPLLGLASLTLVLAFYFVVSGIMQSMFAFELKPNNGWVWTLVGGLVSIALGVMIWRQWPVSGAWAVGTLVGIHLIFDGWSEIALGSAARSAAGEVEQAAG